MPAVIQFRRDTASNWTSNNPTMASGEMGIETDTDKYKIGDGSTAWTGLGYSSLPATAIPDTLINAVGDLIIGTADDTAGRLAVGTDTYVLTADSTVSGVGLAWAASTSGDITGVTAGTLLDGGGTSGSVTLNVDLSEASTSTSDGDGDYFIVTDAASAQHKLTKANIALSGMNNDSGWTANAGDITAVVAGTNIGGGATSGSAPVNLALDAAVDFGSDGSGVDVSFHSGTGSDLMLWDASDKALEFTDSQITMGDNLVESAQMKDYSETVNAAGSKSAAFDLDFEDGNVQTVTFTSGTFNVGIVNALAAHSNSLTILLTNGGTATPSFKAGANGGGGNAVKWAGGTAPTLTTSGTDVICFTTFDGGTNYYGFAAGLDFSAP